MLARGLTPASQPVAPTGLVFPGTAYPGLMPGLISAVPSGLVAGEARYYTRIMNTAKVQDTKHKLAVIRRI